jgi:hypothetical protein
VVRVVRAQSREADRGQAVKRVRGGGQVEACVALGHETCSTLAQPWLSKLIVFIGQYEQHLKRACGFRLLALPLTAAPPDYEMCNTLAIEVVASTANRTVRLALLELPLLPLPLITRCAAPWPWKWSSPPDSTGNNRSELVVSASLNFHLLLSPANYEICSTLAIEMVVSTGQYGHLNRTVRLPPLELPLTAAPC